MIHSNTPFCLPLEVLLLITNTSKIFFSISAFWLLLFVLNCTTEVGIFCPIFSSSFFRIAANVGLLANRNLEHIRIYRKVFDTCTQSHNAFMWHRIFSSGLIETKQFNPLRNLFLWFNKNELSFRMLVNPLAVVSIFCYNSVHNNLHTRCLRSIACSANWLHPSQWYKRNL